MESNYKSPIDVLIEDINTLSNSIEKQVREGYDQMVIIADDSGIVVDALGGAPGVYSARYGGPELDDEGRNLLLLREMEGVPWEKRTAHYTAAVCCVFPDGETITAEGEMHGFVGTEQHGNGGFGYDPLFYVPQPDGSLKTAAQLTDDEKDAISHRGNALRLFKQELLKRIG